MLRNAEKLNMLECGRLLLLRHSNWRTCSECNRSRILLTLTFTTLLQPMCLFPGWTRNHFWRYRYWQCGQWRCFKWFGTHPAVAAPIPPLWCRWIVYLLCLAAVSPHVLTIVWLTCLRKGPIDRVAFPAANATVSPFQQLGQYIMILGQKIDSAQELKDTLHKSCLYHCLFICVSWFFCFFLARRSWTSTLQHMEKQKSYLVLLECMMLDIFVFHALATVTSRLADGMGTPLHKLQTVYTQMVNMQGEAMAEAPTRPCLWTLIAWPCFLAISQFKYLFSSCLRKCVTREKMDALSKHYVTCTKEDTMMNVWLVRAKCDPYWSMFVKIAF